MSHARPRPDADPAQDMELFRLRLTGGNPVPPPPRPEAIAAMREAAARLRLGWAESVPRGRESRHVLETSAGPLPVTLHLPRHDPARGTLLFLHGGGWTIFDSETHAPLMRALVARSGWAVAGLDYPRAPEAPFPAAVRACAEAVDAIARGGLGVEHTGPLAIGGDSSGANLAVAACLLRREVGRPQPAALLLFYGVYDCDLSRRSFSQFGTDTYPLSSAKMAWFWDRYCPDAATRRSRLASPLHADLAGLPPTRLVVAGRDVLRDENLAMATRLAEAGVRTTLDVYPDAIHAFCEAVGFVQTSRAAVDSAAWWLCAATGTTPPRDGSTP